MTYAPARGPYRVRIADESRSRADSVAPESKGLAGRRREPHPLSSERHRASRWIVHLSGRGISPRGGVGRRIRSGSAPTLTRTREEAPAGVDFVARGGSTTEFIGVPGSWSGPSRATTLGRASIGPQPKMHSRFPVNTPSLVRLLRNERAEIKTARGRTGLAFNTASLFCCQPAAQLRRAFMRLARATSN